MHTLTLPFPPKLLIEGSRESIFMVGLLQPNLWSLVPMPRVSFIGANNANLGQRETCTVFWWVHLHYLSHIHESYGVANPQRGLTHGLLPVMFWAVIGLFLLSASCQGLLNRSCAPNGSNIVHWRGYHVFVW